MLSITNLQKQYERASDPALKKVSMEVAEGELIAVLGKSGAGKSTFIRCLNRLIDPTAGEIIWDDQNILQLQGSKLREYRRGIGMIFQSFHLIDRMDAITNVLVGQLGFIPLWRALLLRFSMEEKKLAFEALDRVGLKEHAMKRVSLLSGGQRQRVAIARALMQKPKMILGDEPVASLDPITAKSVMELLAKINKEDTITMIINLHDVTLAKAYATRIIGIANGHIVYDGTPENMTEETLEKIYSSGGSS